MNIPFFRGWMRGSKGIDIDWNRFNRKLPWFIYRPLLTSLREFIDSLGSPIDPKVNIDYIGDPDIHIITLFRTVPGPLIITGTTVNLNWPIQINDRILLESMFWLWYYPVVIVSFFVIVNLTGILNRIHYSVSIGRDSSYLYCPW